MRKVAMVIVGGIAMAVGLFFWSGGRIITIEYEDFPQNEPEKLRPPEKGTFGELIFTGPLKFEARSRWTQWAMRLFPGHFMVDAKVDSRKVTLLVDTGAALTVLSPKVATAAHASLMAVGPEITHWQQKIPTYLGYVQELEISGLKAYHVPVLILGKQPVLKLLGLPVYRVDGLLGMSLMEKLAVTLDWRTGTVTFHREPLSLEVPSAPLRLFEQELHGFKILSPIVDGFLDEAGPYMILIDTGASPAEILVSDELLEALGWKGRVLVRHLKLGEIELKDVPAIPAREREATGVKLKGPVMLIGGGFFQAQGIKRLTLDFLGGKLYAER